jgi:hypothetical protein
VVVAATFAIGKPAGGESNALSCSTTCSIGPLADVLPHLHIACDAITE